MPYLLSLVIPCFNEADVVEATHKRLCSTAHSLSDYEMEFVFVDDGSQDDTLPILLRLREIDPRVKVIAFSRNFGHQQALTAGVEHAKGDAVVLLDADLQDPPEVIPEMVQRWRQGAEVVYGKRTDRDGESRWKRATASTFYRAINWLSDTPIPIDTGEFRLMDRKVVDALLQMPENDRFIRGMVSWTGFRQEPLAFRRAKRAAGGTKYSLMKQIALAGDGIFSFSLVPLRTAITLGFIASTMALIGIIYAVVARLLTTAWVPGWAMLFCAITFFSGVQLISLGIIGEYIGRIYREAKGRPLYVIREHHGFGVAKDVKAQSSCSLSV